MAIIDSIFLEKASGSIDNLTYYQLNGQQVVRSRNRNPYDPMTETQLLQRAKMANTVFSYRYLKEWLIPIKPMITGARTLYNQYTSMFTELFPSVRYYTLHELLNFLTSTNIGTSNYCIVNSFTIVDLQLTVNFSTEGSSWYEDTKIYVIATAEASTDSFLYVINVSQESWNNGVFTALLSAGITSTLGLHINSVINNKCSNIKF